jgi:glycosyltransferase involved in cell wall biosynthesis
MRILQAMAGAERGGAEAYFVSLVKALARRGYEQMAAIRHNAGRAKLLREAAIATVELPFGGFFDFRTGPELGRIIASFRPAIAVSWMGRASALLPRGLFVHIGRLGGYYDLKYFRRCDHLVANTRELARYCVEAGWPETRVHYLPNFASFRVAAPEDRARWQTPENAPLILALGRLHRSKAFDVLMRALARVPEAVAWIAGEGEERDALARVSAELGIGERVRFLGWRDDKEALFAAADLCVVPSRFEPFGNVVLEAWAAGKPVIAAAALGPAAIVRDGENGLLVPVEDDAALAQAIERLLKDRALATTLAAGGGKTLAAEYSEAQVLRAWDDLFAKCVGDPATLAGKMARG